MSIALSTEGAQSTSSPTDGVIAPPGYSLVEEKSTSSVRNNAFPKTLADLQIAEDVFGRNDIYRSLDGIRKSTLSISNRLKSILHDAEFIKVLWTHLSTQACRESTIWPLVPNERSGSWPLDPELKSETQRHFLSNRPEQQSVSAYFKSTDGHINQWAFSTRRLNLPVLELLGESGNAILVDTTRRGKTFPDALRRTVPVWCAVWNTTLFPDLVDSGVCSFHGHNLSIGEIHQISARIPQFLKDLKQLKLDLGAIKNWTNHPIRCVWVHAPEDPSELAYTLQTLAAAITSERRRWRELGINVNILVCCSASRPVSGAEGDGPGLNYIQGAGDDAEAWGHGLNARLFWQNRAELEQALACGEEALQEIVVKLVQEDKSVIPASKSTRIAGTNVYISTTPDAHAASSSLLIDCQSTGTTSAKAILSMKLKDGKLGSRALRDQCQLVMSTVQNHLKQEPDATVLVICRTARDLSVGVVLIIVCLFCDDSGQWLRDGRVNDGINKVFIKRRLAWITTVKPDANPSRSTLQAVNSFLMK